jgi:hypothetical protein
MSPQPLGFTVRQRQIWRKWNDYIRQEGGWTSAEPNTSPVQFQCEMNSELPELLREAGYDVRHLGTHERLLPVGPGQGIGVGTVDIWSFDPPSLRPERPERLTKTSSRISVSE